eukprot:TRINITY_DN3425_c0_g1_i1.p1 TRINITY_DN3425_c0_g1~~TRINITY_DN3425_c0_g1_i1.p1  ORF type:complete len:163 (+),score=4.08 TRINITY_DN3425_c0_g1_i1:73-561(+)
MQIYSIQGGLKSAICTKTNMISGTSLSCERNYGFSDRTYIDISYKQSGSRYDASGSWSKSADKMSTSDTCTGYIDTSCSRDIVGDLVTECNDVMVIGWRDMKDSTVCDEQLSPNLAVSNREERLLSVKKKKWDGSILQIGLIIAGCFTCFCHLLMFKGIRIG